MNLLANSPTTPPKISNSPRSTSLYFPLKLCVCVTRLLLLLFSAFSLDGFVARPTRGAGTGVWGGSGSELLPRWGVAMKLNISQVFSSYFDLLLSLFFCLRCRCTFSTTPFCFAQSKASFRRPHNTDKENIQN